MKKKSGVHPFSVFCLFRSDWISDLGLDWLQGESKIPKFQNSKILCQLRWRLFSTVLDDRFRNFMNFFLKLHPGKLETKNPRRGLIFGNKQKWIK